MSERITPDKFPFDWYRGIKVQKRTAGNPGTRRNIKYLDIITAFDIETTRIVEIEQSIMYVWMYQFGKEYTVIGRTWEEFTDFTQKLSEATPEGVQLLTFVHNLSYEFQFLRGVYNFNVEEVFALDKRKVLKNNIYNKIEMRCSYIHSNMSLDVYTHKMGAEHAKLSGADFDYSKARYPWTELTEKEYEYITNDVLGLVEAIEIEMNHDKDTLYTFPLTSTGYVRRDAKKAMRAVSHTFVKNQLPDYHIYEMLREAFRGGNTHANRYYAGKILNNVKSADESSAYPAQQCNEKFPVSEFQHIGGCTFDELMKLINVRKKAVIMRISMTNVRLIDEFWGAPYLARDKCRNIREPLLDNGRILKADYLETTITDVDLRIILSEYDFDDFVAFEVAHARYGKLPPSLIEETIKYFRVKTSMKDVKGEELFYMKSKNKLNSIYGMMAQDPVKQTIEFINDDFASRKDNPQDLLNKSNGKAFLAYQWGVWVTAWARYRLEEGIRLAGDGFIYCDTDSVKYIGDIDWDAYNKDRIIDSKKSGAYATDPTGTVHYMGVYELETEHLPNQSYYEFSTLGAKKYCYRETPDTELKVTIAGVTKKKGGAELERHGGIKAFKAGFVFTEAGGMEAIYNDNPEIKTYKIDGREIAITSNVVLKEGTYTLGIAAEYEKLLSISAKILDI